MPIISMKPSRQFDGSLDRVVIGAGISPFTQTSGLDEALGLAVGLGVYGLVNM